MIYTRFNSDDSHAVNPLADMSAVIDVLGTDAFGARLESLMLESFGLTEFFVFQRSLPAGQPVALYAASRQPLAGERARVYCAEFHREDPVLAVLTPESEDGMHYMQLPASAIRNPRYRTVCFTRPGIQEKLTLARKSGEHLLVINIYAREADGGFSPAQVDSLCQFAPMLLPLIALHFRLVGEEDERPQMSVGQMEDCVAWTFPSLTGREVAVCARSILGVTAEGIALDLGIRQTSVLTYRRRAYARLNINSINQMSAMLIQSSAARKLAAAG